MRLWDPYKRPRPPRSNLRSRLDAVRRELAALADGSGAAGSAGADLQACGPLTLIEIGGRQRLATIGRCRDGRRVIGVVLRNGTIARRIADARAFRPRQSGD